MLARTIRTAAAAAFALGFGAASAGRRNAGAAGAGNLCSRRHLGRVQTTALRRSVRTAIRSSSRAAARAGALFSNRKRPPSGWSEPHIAPFSGQWNDWAPEFAPDGSYVVFVSVRPETHANLWRSDRTAGGWSAPVRLPDAVNIGPSVWKPSMAADGSIYFVSIDAKGGKRLYCSRYKDGRVSTRAAAFVQRRERHGDVDPEVAPDESFMIFASDGRVPGDTKDHLFIAFNRGGVWQTPEPIRYAGDDAGGYSADNEPHLSHDLHTLYFSSDRVTRVHFPRTPEQAQQDLERLNSWDNTNAQRMVGADRPAAGPALNDRGSTLHSRCRNRPWLCRLPSGSPRAYARRFRKSTARSPATMRSNFRSPSCGT